MMCEKLTKKWKQLTSWHTHSPEDVHMVIFPMQVREEAISSAEAGACTKEATSSSHGSIPTQTSNARHRGWTPNPWEANWPRGEAPLQTTGKRTEKQREAMVSVTQVAGHICHFLSFWQKQFNSAFNKKHFKMDTFQDICQLVDRDDYMTSVDLKDAYYSVNVKFCHRMKLQFSWAGTRYQFTCLPNGYWDGLCMFTKILKPVLAHVHHSQGNVLMYLDDS